MSQRTGEVWPYSTSYRDKISVQLPVISLDEDPIGFHFFDKLLGSLSKHRRLVHGSNKEDLLAIEALCEVNHGCLKAVFSIVRLNYE